MQYISPVDFLIAPIYIFVLFFFIKSKAIKYKGSWLSRFYISTFFLHIMGAVLYAMVIQYYYGYGDSLGFFRASTFLSNLTKDEFTLKYFFYSPSDLSNLFLNSETGDNAIGAVLNNSSNLIIIKISAALSLLSFNKYLVVSLFFGLFSFAGIWRLFIVFNEVLQNKGQKILALTVLYTPSIWFWGSGLIKDSICMGCLGLVVSYIYKIFIKKKFSFTDLLLLGIFFYILFIVKSYIALVLLLAIVVFSVHYFIVNRRTAIEKWIFSILISLTGMLLFAFMLRSYITSLVEDSKATVDTFKSVYESMDSAGESGSGFAGKSIDFTVSGIIISSPINIFTALYRPFLWEVRNVMMIFSSLESFVALIALFYLLAKTKWKFFSYIFSNPFILFAFVFVMVLSLIIGLTTFNFGTMVRYRIPIFPFYCFLLLSVYVKYKEKQLAKKAAVEI